MARSFHRPALAAALALTLAACADLGTVADVVFPSTVPGLPADGAWTSLPLRRWLTESGIEPVAISACMDCVEPAVAGLFRARGQEAAALRAAARDPAALVSMLARAPGGRARKPAMRARVTADAASEGGRPGYLVRLTRTDGSRQAAGYVTTVDEAGAVQILVIVAASEASARTLARSIVPKLGG